MASLYAVQFLKRGVAGNKKESRGVPGEKPP